MTNVTLSSGAGGVVRQRRNVGEIDAWGLEADLAWRMTETLEIGLTGAWTTAEVDGGTAAAQLTGLRPAQTPEVALSATVLWEPIEPLRLRATARHEGDRWDDDLNTRRLSAATSLDLRVDWRATPTVDLYLAAENVTDAAVQTARTGDGIVSYDQPRTVRVGMVWRP
ncbi:TonB-dependent receptor [Caulobacter mirabilis]|uniref:TonB-dependent receptor n=1 Tax=Caulobacter mirabilis TaxID=69666 RepID=UPI0026B5C3BB